VSSRADDFDVRHRGLAADRPGGFGAAGGPDGTGGFPAGSGTVDYDLGYDVGGWDTQGFRSLDAAYRDIEEASHRAGVGVAAPPAAGRPAARGRAPGAHAARHLVAPGGAAPDRGVPGGAAPGRAAPGRRARGGPVKARGSWWRHWTLRKALGVACGVIGGLIVLAAIAVVVAYEQTPVPTEAMAATGFQQSVVYSGNGSLIGRFGTMDRQMLTYSQLQQSKWLIPAVLAAEDRGFWTEGGISLTGIIRAAYEDVKGSGGSLQGGSTITQQFVRNYYVGIGTQQTLSRKIKEIFVALKVAKEKSKQWILTNYLNTIYLGDGAYGVGAAAQTYYHEPVSRLTAAQAAVIAAVIQQPSTYYLPQYRPQLEARWHYVLDGMVRMGDLTARQAAAMTFPPPGNHVPQTVGRDPWDPYVLNVVYNELVQLYHFSQSQIYNGGYVIKTTIDDAKMKALYQAVQQNEQQMAAGGVPLPSYAHVGAVLENPANGAIEAMYPGPGYPGSRYVDAEGQTRTMTARQCRILDCEVNMAVYNREQVGSSFKPYVLAAAVRQGMNVQTSMLDGQDNVYIPLDSEPKAYPATSMPPGQAGWYLVHNDSPAENGPYTPQMAMAESINTAYADLWHYVGGAAVADMAQLFGVNTAAAGITGPGGMEHEAGVALGQASLTVAEQATMLATIDDGGVYHDAHVIASITQPASGLRTPIKITSYPVFSSDPTQNADDATQIQYAMSKDTAPYGTAPTAAMSNGQEVIAKTGTTNTAQSAFFIGAIPSQALAVGIFTNRSDQPLPPDLGGNPQGGYGGTWPALIWHTYAENMFVPLGIEQFPAPVFSGQAWNLVPPGLRQPPAKPHKKQHRPPGRPNPFPTPPVPGTPFPAPTYACNPQVVTCVPGNGNPQGG
jgi:membrane peptidoglycan carboxypeptidase